MSKANPIQEQMEQLLLKWDIATNTPNVNIIRVHAKADDNDMLEAFFQYMLALDIGRTDFVFIFSSNYTSKSTYSETLLKELEEEINTWNKAKAPESLNHKTIDWKPNFSLKSANNPTTLFIENINQFANYIFPDKNNKVSILLLPENSLDLDTHYTWLNELLEHQFEPHVFIGISDLESQPFYNNLAIKHPEKVYTLISDFNTDKAIEQMAAISDQSQEEDPYRTNLAKLMNAVKNRESSKVGKASKKCLNIAVKKLDNDPNWLMQIVTVYTILYNDQIGYKNYNEAIFFANKAVESALLSQNLLAPEVAYRLIGQTHLGRGTLFHLKKKREKALDDFIHAVSAFETCNDNIMHCEALRLAGWMSEKTSNKKQALDLYIKAYYLKDNDTFDLELLKVSTYPLIIKQLLKINDRHQVLSNQQMDKDMSEIFGNNWENYIENYANIPKSKVN